MNKLWGQLLMVGIPGQELDEITRCLIQDLQVGGIILFKRNIAHPQQVAALIRDCQKMALAASGYPLFVAVDQEGGPVQRLRATISGNALGPPVRPGGRPVSRGRLGSSSGPGVALPGDQHQSGPGPGCAPQSRMSPLGTFLQHRSGTGGPVRPGRSPGVSGRRGPAGGQTFSGLRGYRPGLTPGSAQPPPRALNKEKLTCCPFAEPLPPAYPE